MCFAELLYWARRNGRILHTAWTATTGWSQALPADPDRWSVMIPGYGTYNIAWNFSYGAPVNVNFLPNQQVDQVIVTEDMIGELITLPLWLMSSTGGTVFDIPTVSYDPVRKGVLNRVIESDLSRTPAP